MSNFAHLERFVQPESVAVVGASPNPSSQGGRLYANVRTHSRVSGQVYAVNPNYQQIGADPCWPSIADLPDGVQIDVALLMVNQTLVLPTLRECARRQIPFAIVMSSGFSEAGPQGARLEQEIKSLCRETGLRVYGPNCPGFVNIRARLGLTFSPAFKDDLVAGPIGLATQGGGLGRNIIQGLSQCAGVGMWFSPGNEVDLDLPDFIAHMANDPDIKVIGLLIEGIRDGQRLIRSLELAQRTGTSVVALKIGHSEQGVKAAQSHTAAIAGSARINSAVLAQYGVIEVNDLDDLIAVAQLLCRARPTAGTGLCIFTFSGGTAALAADIAGTQDLPLAQFSESTLAALKSKLPGFAAISNPVDTTADILRDPAAAMACLRMVCEDEHTGAVLYPIPMDYGQVTDDIADAIIEVSSRCPTPVIPVWMSRRLGGGFHKLEDNGLQPFLSISSAVRALKAIWPVSQDDPMPARQRAAGAGDTAHTESAEDFEKGQLAVASNATQQLGEFESKSILAAAGIRFPVSELAQDATQAIEIHQRIGGPVAMKISSPDIAHKTEAGGVILNLDSGRDVQAAFHTICDNVRKHSPQARIDGVLVQSLLPANGLEVLLGYHQDPTFGPMLTFGLGGIFVELLDDVTHLALPTSSTLLSGSALRPSIIRMIHQIHYSEVLYGVRGKPPFDIDGLIDLITRFALFAIEHRESCPEIELNPVWVGPTGQGAIALDALITRRVSVAS